VEISGLMDEIEKKLEAYFDRLWPITRSITGNGLRESFHILQELIPLELIEVKSGTKVFDWEVPKEWNIRDAYIQTPDGTRIAQLKDNNLHVLNYSIPVNKTVSFQELEKHVFTLPEQPDAIPYVTSYYKETWGFCLSHNEWQGLPKEGEYRVVIDSTLEEGSLTYGQVVLPGSTKQEVLFSSYLCHPSMANNELSGPLAMAFLYQKIAQIPNRKLSYRFVLAPETVGVIAFLSKYGNLLKENLIAGYVLTCCGDLGDFTYKRSKDATALCNRAAEHCLHYSEVKHKVIDFAVGGSDERQYCSPGFNLPVGSLMRTPYQKYKEYHTSLDNKSFISFSSLRQTIELYENISKTLEINGPWECNVPFGEPQLGKRGLYPSSVSPDAQRENLHDLLHLISFSDGKNDLITIAEKRDKHALEFEEHLVACRNKGLF
jgi:aminopeptidase-like protein